MSKLQELIDRLCPDGVPFKPLGELLIPLKKGTLKTTDLISGASIPVINSGRDLYGYYDKANNNGPAITIAARGEYAGWISFFDKPFWAGGLCYPYKSKSSGVITEKFVFYYLKSKETYIMESLVARGSIPALNKSDLDKLPIPIPPLEVQEEIVRILDTFSAYAEVLKGELQARKEQYEYYRNLLLSFNRTDGATDDEQEVKSTIWGGHSYEIAWKTMGEIAKLVTTRINSNEVDSYIGVENLLKDKAGAIPTSEFPMGDSCIGFNPNDILIGNIRPYLKKIWFADRGGGTNGDVLTIRLTDTQLTPRFLYHILASDNFFLYHNQYAKGAKMPRGDKSMVMKYNIPIPPLEVQEKIVGILDRFEALVNDLTQGLPAELQARKEQYEYYRNKLLTFNELN